MGAIAGITTGSYDKRIGDREADVSSLEAAGAQLSNRVGSAQDRLRELEGRLAARKSNLQKIRAEIAAIDRTIASARASITALQSARDGAKEDLARKVAIHQKLLDERNTLDRMVQDLERQEVIEADLYERNKKAPQVPSSAPGSGDVRIAEMEKRATALDQKTAEASQRLQRLKIMTAQAGT